MQDPSSRPPKKYREVGTGHKAVAQKVRLALFHWFIDVRESLKGCLRRRFFKSEAQQMHADWLVQKHVAEGQKFKFSSKWIKVWE